MNIEDDKSFPPEPPRQPEESPTSTDPAAPSGPFPSGISPEMGSASVQEFSMPAGPPIPEDLRVPWSWIDLLFLVLVYLGAAIVLGLLVKTGSVLFRISPTQIQKSLTERNLLTLLMQVLLDLVLFAYLAAQMRLQFGRPFWRTIGWRPMRAGTMPRALVYSGLILGGLFLGMMITLASAVSPPKGKVPIQTFFQDRQTAFLMILMGVLLAPLVEETLFRGYLYPVLARSFGVSAGVLVTGTLFGLLHAQQLWGGWLQIALLVVVGIVFTYARAATGTVLTSYLLHLSYNSYQLIGFLIASHGLRHLPTLQ
jgi:hypothetical protein